jgi:hypothetical protein
MIQGQYFKPNAYLDLADKQKQQIKKSLINLQQECIHQTK